MLNGWKSGSSIYPAVLRRTHKVGKLIGIFGTAGMAKETRDIAVQLGLSVVFVARDVAELAVFGDAGDAMLEMDIHRFRDIPYVIGIGDCLTRRQIAKRFASKIEFCNLIHPTATFGLRQREYLENKQGVIVSAGVRFTCNILIGDFTIFNLNATISHDCIIGDFVTVCPQTCILGNVEIKSGGWIGAGAVVNQGSIESKLTIGKNTVIGSGAVVTRDCDENSIYVGVPARRIR